MTEETIPNTSFWAGHRLLLLVLISIGVSLAMVITSLVIYTNSGTAQLDLSRPGYESVSDQVESGDLVSEYSATGAITSDALDEFQKMFSEELDKAKAIDAFGGDVLSTESLGLDQNENE